MGNFARGGAVVLAPSGPQMHDKVQAFSRHRAVIDYHRPYFEQLPLSVVPDANTRDFDILQARRPGGRAEQLLLNILELQRARAPKKVGARDVDGGAYGKDEDEGEDRHVRGPDCPGSGGTPPPARSGTGQSAAFSGDGGFRLRLGPGLRTACRTPLLVNIDLSPAARAFPVKH